MSDNYDYRDNLIDQENDVTRDVGVEKALLALCMRNEQSVLEIAGNGLDSSDFSDPRNAYIYNAIIALFYENRKVDRFSVSDFPFLTTKSFGGQLFGYSGELEKSKRAG